MGPGAGPLPHPKLSHPHPNLDLLINVQQMTNLTKQGRQKFYAWQGNSQKKTLQTTRSEVLRSIRINPNNCVS